MGKRKSVEGVPASVIASRARAVANYHKNRDRYVQSMRDRRRNNLDSERAREREKSKAYREVNRTALRAAAFLKKHGITVEQRDLMLKAQGGVCAICNTSDFGKRGPMMDHDHDSGLLRAVLCTKCNVGLGAFDDHPGRLRDAAEYLEAHRQRE